MRFRSIRWLVALGLVLLGCGARATPPSWGTVTVLAAASLSEAFAELAQRYEAEHPGVHVVLSLAGSQLLAQQLAQGAPADVFASANTQQIDRAVEAGRVAAGSARSFARNRLVIVVPGDNPAGLNSLQDLAKPGVKLILAAAEVPVGQYALQFLDRAGREPNFGAEFKATVLINVVSYEENVKSVLAKVVLGEADAGIVYDTDAAQAGAGKVGTIAIPDELNSLATYAIAVLTDAAQPELAQDFVGLVLSAEGQAVLKGYGFEPGGE